MIAFDSFKEGCPWRTPTKKGRSFQAEGKTGIALKEDIEFVCAGQGTSVEGLPPFTQLVGCQKCEETRCAPLYWVNCRR